MAECAGSRYHAANTQQVLQSNSLWTIEVSLQQPNRKKIVQRSELMPVKLPTDLCRYDWPSLKETFRMSSYFVRALIIKLICTMTWMFIEC